MGKMFFAAVFSAVVGISAPASALTVIDLTHPIPTFRPMAGDPMKPDLSEPWGDAAAIPTFDRQAVLAIEESASNQGHFETGMLVLPEHHGTHLDTAAHYINNGESLDDDGIAPPDRKRAHQLEGKDLVGRIVLIDISARVQAELDKNGGRPSPDKSVTDFSNNSPNTVGAEDIAAIAGQLDNGVWLVLNFGWSKFYFEGPDFMKGPYVNAWNHPGLNKQGVDKLIAIMKARNIRINGIVTDNIGTDSGESARGEDEDWTNSWYAHVKLLQRGLKLVENAANLDRLAALADPCLLVVGALKHVGGTGGPARVLAICGR